MEININGLMKDYGERTVLNIESLLFESNKLYGIIGPNGAGKSTLLRIISGLEQSTKGEILYNGCVLNKPILKHITFMSQRHYLLKTTVFNNIAYPLTLRKYHKKIIENMVDEIMMDLQLFELKDQLAISLSGGEAQKVALARALIFEPQLLLLDEPTANIDPNSIKLIEKLILKRNKEKKGTTLMITHNMEQARRLCDEVVFIENGKLKVQGKEKQVLV
ncbi:MAG: ABC transporter [Firmicutes bacterium HGW-Firmicutes-7]|nr:MAG: ABC transporter [Firmicutes bacterium HGW-Firmicutes-7]